APAGTEPGLHDLRRVLDEEINRLTARLRTTFILCCLEGRTVEEAARQLHCPPGTVASRLARARERLRGRLARRGLAPALGGLAALLAEHAQAAPVPGLVEITLKASLLFVAGGAPAAVPVHLARGGLRTMTLSKL